MDDETGATFRVEAGLPQGSPVSPILFMLFLEPLFKVGTPARCRARAGYADNIALLAAGDSLKENYDTLKKDTQEVTEWAIREGLTFEYKKTELIHFSRRYDEDNPSLSLPGPTGEVLVTPVSLKKALRWLGVFFDRKLLFRIYIETLAIRAATAISGIKTLGNIVRGVAPRLFR